MNTHEQIRKYLDEEGIVERSTEEVDEIINRDLPGFPERFDRVAEDYESHIISPSELYDLTATRLNGMTVYDYFKSRSRKGVEWTLRNIIGLNPGEENRVLDVGCGTGLESVFLAEMFRQWEAKGIDVSGKMVEAARARATKRNVTNTEFSVADRDEVDFKDEFDLLLCLHSINEGHYFFDEASLNHVLVRRLERFRTALRDGGKVALTVPIFDPTNFAEGYLDYQKDRMSYILEAAGFNDTSTDFFQIKKPGFDMNYLFLSGVAN